jgi:hypothetical protein
MQIHQTPTRVIQYPPYGPQWPVKALSPVPLPSPWPWPMPVPVPVSMHTHPLYTHPLHTQHHPLPIPMPIPKHIRDPQHLPQRPSGNQLGHYRPIRRVQTGPHVEADVGVAQVGEHGHFVLESGQDLGGEVALADGGEDLDGDGGAAPGAGPYLSGWGKGG